MFEVRPFRHDELEQLTSFWKELMNDPKTIIPVLTTDENVSRWQRYVIKIHDEDENQIFVAEVDGVLVGYVLLLKQGEYPLTTSTSWASINELYVHSSYRRRGIGTRLVEQALKYLKSKGVSHVLINAKVWNQAATNLYRKLGFRNLSLGMLLDL